MSVDIYGHECSVWNVAPWQQGSIHYVARVGDFLAAVAGGQYADAVTKCRRIMCKAIEAENTPAREIWLKAYKRAKEALPVALLQGVNEARRADTFTTFAGCMCIDIDAPKPGEADNGNGWVQDWEQVKNNLAALPWVAWCSTSAGGRGLFLLVPIARTDAASYAGYYTTFAAALRSQYKLFADAACKNANRLRYMSYDPDPVINRAAEVYDISPKPVSRPVYHSPSSRKHESDTAATVERVVTWCVQHRCNVLEDYSDWQRVAAFFAHELPHEAALFHDLASLSPKYNPRENDYKLHNLARSHPRPVGMGTFVQICRNNGVPAEVFSDRRHSKPMRYTHPGKVVQSIAMNPAERAANELAKINPHFAKLCRDLALIPIEIAS